MPTLSQGTKFSHWDGPHVIAPLSSFNFQALLKRSMDLAQAAELDTSGLFSLSPLSSPEPSRSTSPALPIPSDLFPSSLLSLSEDSEPFCLQSPASSSTLIPSAINDPPTPSVMPPIAKRSHGDRAKKKKAQSHARRNKKRTEVKQSCFSPYESRPAVQAKYIHSAMPIDISASLESSQVTSTGYVGLDDRLRSKKTYRLHEAVGPTSILGFMLQEWDGVLSPSLYPSRLLSDNLHRTPMPILDQERRLLAILAGHPEDDCWPDLSREAASVLEEARHQCQIPPLAAHHRRGHFTALQTGVSHGGGQKAPGNLRNSAQNTQVLEELNQRLLFRRISGFATSVLATWAPELHRYYSSTLDSLHTHNPSLKRIFPTSVFAATTYNFGPQTVCFKHTDFGNLAFGMCAVTPFGNFDSKKGGHLILWECGLVIEFPPGSTILLPSATISHSNIMIDSHEHRSSFTQYTAGALFRWVENGFQKSTDSRASLSMEELARQTEKDAERWAWGLSLLPRFILPEGV